MPTAENYHNIGTWFADHKQFLCAAQAFASASKIAPSSSSLHYLWGLSLFSAGDDSAALGPLRRAAKLDQYDIRPHLAAASALDKLKRTADAEIEWRNALDIDADSASALDGLSRDLINQKDYSAVIKALARKLSTGQLSSVQTVNLGIALIATARPEDAIRILRLGLNRDPESLSIANELGIALVLVDQDQEAYKVFEMAIQKHPSDLGTKVLYLHTLVDNGAERAPAYAKQLLAEYPLQWEILYLNGLLASRNGSGRQAHDFLERSIALNPRYGPSRTSFGKVLVSLGDLQGAKEQFEKSIALGDDTPEVEYSLARVLRGLGEMDAARERFQRVQQLNNLEAKEVRAATIEKSGDQSMATGEFSRAAAIYRSALGIDPDDPILHYKLSQALGKMTNTSGEKAELERAIQLDPKLAEAQNQLGYLAAHSGDLQRAESFFRAATQAQPTYVVAWINLAATLATDRKWDEAKAAVHRALQVDPGNDEARNLEGAIAQAHPQP